MIHFLIFATLVASTVGQTCNTRVTSEGSVCVCNAKYCDVVPEIDVSSGKYQVFSTSKAKLGFYSTTGSFIEDVDTPSKSTIVVDQTSKYQTIIGFGGAFTDSTGINIKSLPEAAQSKLIESYFGKSGIEYSLCRVPIGGTDFSTRGYSYDDVEGDTTLEHFALQEDDLNYKIPFIQQANALRDTPLQLFGSAWTAPTWMKTNGDWAGIGMLKDEYYQLWADYILKFFEEYEKHDIPFWGMTTQNEPIDGLIPKFLMDINSMGWLPSQMNKWVGENLGPTIRNSKYSHLKIILHDDTRLSIPLVLPVLSNETTMSYADGAAVHWYTDFLIPAVTLNLLKADKEGWFFLSTEACSGSLTFIGLDKPIRIGSWSRGEDYVKDIIENLEYGAAGWVDWNMVLDMNGGPTYIDNFVDSPILVNATAQEFYKQPMYYAMGHFSKFVVPGSVRVEATVDDELENVKSVAFLRPDNLIALTVFNRGDEKVNIRIKNDNGGVAVIGINARSINTVLYQAN